MTASISPTARAPFCSSTRPTPAHTGIKPEELIGRKVADIEAEGILYTGSVTGRVLEQQARVNSVATIHRLDKEVLVTGTPVFDNDGNIRLVVTNTRDFPELKQMEQQLLALTQERQKADEELAFLRQQQAGGKEMYYQSEAMRQVVELIHTVAPTDVTVLITGEIGHRQGAQSPTRSTRPAAARGRPFIKVNCAAIPAELLESELFGYEEGAFTGARRTGKAGMFELANTGVILLDEIGDMPLPLQAKLLRGAPEPGAHPDRRQQACEAGSAGHCRYQSRPAGGGSCRPLSGGSVLPAQRGTHRAQAPAGAQGGHPLSGGALLPGFQ